MYLVPVLSNVPVVPLVELLTCMFCVVTVWSMSPRLAVEFYDFAVLLPQD